MRTDNGDGDNDDDDNNQDDDDDDDGYGGGVVVVVAAAPIFVHGSLSPAQLDALHSEATSSGACLRTWRPAPGPWQRLEHC